MALSALEQIMPLCGDPLCLFLEDLMMKGYCVRSSYRRRGGVPRDRRTSRRERDGPRCARQGAAVSRSFSQPTATRSSPRGMDRSSCLSSLPIIASVSHWMCFTVEIASSVLRISSMQPRIFPFGRSIREFQPYKQGYKRPCF